MATKYVSYTDPSLEPTIPNEDALIQELFDVVRSVQGHNFSMHRHAFRGTHVKTQGIVKGTLTIEPNLPPELAQALASPENALLKHDIALRYANEPSFLQDDRTPGPRGCGVKIFGVMGKFLNESGAKSKTQDLTFNNAPMLELRDLPTTVDIFKIRERHFREPEKIEQEIRATKSKQEAEVQLAPASLPNQHFVSYTMYSQSAYRWGDYVAKYALFPTGNLQEELSKLSIQDTSSPEQHSVWLREYFAKNDATYDLRVQLLENKEEQSVEDTATPWEEEKYPFRTVAKIVFPKGQDSFNSQRRTFWEDSMKLNVWYGLEELRPMGSVNRLRRHLYEQSQQFREMGNAKKVVEIDSIDQIP